MTRSIAAPPRWTGSIDLYRPGAFSTQRTWRWCTAAVLQIMRNIDRREADHSRRQPAALLLVHAGPRPLRHPPRGRRRPGRLGSRAAQVGRPELPGGRQEELRGGAPRRGRASARDEPARRHRRRPRHARLGPDRLPATADPAVDDRFRVTSVRVVGPLWGLQSRSFGYDMRPNTRLTRAQLRRFFTPWHYPRIRMVWEGRWVSIQPVGG